jgi:CDP-diacylglycerol--glycerol-3-phosphate 3-phosphatidyltransferase/cardiolipin synthase
MTEHEAAGTARGDRQVWGAADLLTIIRLPLAVAFVVVPGLLWRSVILAIAAGTDLADGWIARRLGPSRFGAFLDPLVDKLFMACAFGVVLASGALRLYEVLAVLSRDIVAAFAFFTTLVRGHPSSIPARAGGKAVTVGQGLTLAAFLFESPLLRPLTWATAAVALYAIWDYQHVAKQAARKLGA